MSGCDADTVLECDPRREGRLGIITVGALVMLMAPVAPCEADRMGAFGDMEGAWDVEASDRVSAGEFEQTSGTAVASLDRDRCILQVSYVGDRQGAPYESVDVIRALEGGGFELARTDSEHGDTTVSVGRLEGDRAIFDWSRDLGNRVMRTRTVWHFTSGAHVRIERELSRSDGAPWERTYSASLRRQARAGATDQREPAFNSYPNWSPDGASIVFGSDRSGDSELYVVRVDGDGLERITDSPGVDAHPAWSPDGSMIAFDSDRTGDREIHVLDLGSRNVRRMTDSAGWDGTPFWDSTGRALLFYSERDGNAELYEVSLDDGIPRRLTRTEQNEYYGSWSPDGASIVFEYEVGGDRDVHILDLRSGARRALVPDEARDHLPAWSPDGERVLFASRRTGDDDIYAVRADGAGLVNLTNHPSADVMGKWSPDGSQVVFVSNRAGGFNLYLMSAAGGEARAVER